MDILGKIRDKKILLLFALLYVLVFIFFYPPFYMSEDSQIYSRQAYLLMHGKFFITNPLYQYTYTVGENGFFSKYPVGQSLWLMPFLLLGWNALFLSGLVMHLLGFFVFYKLIKRAGINPLYSLFYLFFPASVFVSRTLLSETASMVLILAGLYFYLRDSKKDSLLSGVAFGLSFLFRYPNVIAFFPFALFSLIKDRKKFLHLVAGFLPFIGISLIYNFLTYGNPFTIGYSFSGEFNLFSLPLFPFRLFDYIVLLSIAFPLMFFSIFLFRSEAKKEIAAAALLTVLFYSFYTATHMEGKLQDVVIGFRYILPIVPFFIFAYAGILEKFLKSFGERFKFKHNYPLALLLLLLVIAYPVISYEQYKIQQNRYEVFNKIYSETTEGSLLIGGNAESYLSEIFGDRRYIPMHNNDPANINRDLSNEEHIYHIKLFRDVENNSESVTIMPWEEFLGGRK